MSVKELVEKIGVIVLVIVVALVVIQGVSALGEMMFR